MTRTDPTTGTSTNTTTAGWSIVNNTTHGGIGAFQNFVYVTDEDTNGGSDSGVVRFDISTNTAVRFANGLSTTDLSMGLDGKLYAVLSTGNVNVYDPVTLAFIRTITMPVTGAITVDQNGNIFVVSGTTVYRLNSNGVIQASKATGMGGLFADIDVNIGGRLVIANQDGHVVLGDSSLSNFTSFTAINDPHAVQWETFVAFAGSPFSVPEPSSAWLLLLGGAFALPLVRRFKSA